MRRRRLVIVGTTAALLVGGIALAGPASADTHDRRSWFGSYCDRHPDSRWCSWRSDRDEAQAEPAEEEPVTPPVVDDRPWNPASGGYDTPGGGIMQDEPEPEPQPAEESIPSGMTAGKWVASDGYSLEVKVFCQNGSIVNIHGEMNSGFTNQIGIWQVKEMNDQANRIARDGGDFNSITAPPSTDHTAGGVIGDDGNPIPGTALTWSHQDTANLQAGYRSALADAVAQARQQGTYRQ